MTEPRILPLTPLGTVIDRQTRMLRTALGPVIGAALDDPEIVEVMLNPDGALWVDRLGSGRSASGFDLSPAAAERIVRLVAAHVRVEVHAGAPIVSAELPETGERFEGLLPPVVRAPVFATVSQTRQPVSIRLERYVADGILTQQHVDYLAPCGQGSRATSSLPAAPQPARRPWPMRYCRRWRAPAIE